MATQNSAETARQGVGCGLSCHNNNSEVVVVRHGAPFHIVARNRLDEVTFTGPVASGDRLYLRLRRSLVCIASSGEAGVKLEKEYDGRELFDSCARLPMPPEVRPLPTLAPVAGWNPGPDAPVCKAYEQLGPDRWLVAGPFPMDDTDHLGAALADLRPAPGVTVGDKAFAPLDPQFLQSTSGLREDLFGRKSWGSAATIDLGGLSLNKGKAVFYLATIVEVTHPKALRWMVKGGDSRVTLAGTPIQNEQVLRLEPGLYPLVLRVKIGAIPPFAKDRKLTLSPNLVQVDDPMEALTTWKATVAPYRERLDAAVANLPQTRTAFEARLFLEKLGMP